MSVGGVSGTVSSAGAAASALEELGPWVALAGASCVVGRELSGALSAGKPQGGISAQGRDVSHSLTTFLFTATCNLKQSLLVEH